jgi:phosphoribosylglycinamide formyltransferase-1
VSGTAQPSSIVVLISGRGSNMRAIVEQSLRADASYRVALVVSDQPDAAGLKVARDFGIDTHSVAVDAATAAVESSGPTTARAAASDSASDRESRRERYDERLAAVIDERAPSLIVLAGFMRILSAKFVARYPGKILNIHPSLLPRYPGLHTHRKVLAARETHHGATVHFVTAELDGGPPVIHARVTVEPQDDESTLAARVQTAEHRIYPLAVRWYCEGRLRCEDGRAWLDGRALDTPLLYEEDTI